MSTPVILANPIPPPVILNATGTLDAPTTLALLTALTQFITLPAGAAITSVKSGHVDAHPDGTSTVRVQYSV